MAEIPVPASIYFNDFKYDLVELKIMRNNQEIARLKGMPNEEYGEKYFHFLYGSDIKTNDTLVSGASIYTVRRVETETYQGKPELVRVVY